jgi:hypothetical protein
MVSRRKTPDEPAKRRRPPAATTPEGREQQLIALAVDLAEKQMAEGTASSQVISHYLKLGSSREKLEQERLARENELLAAKKDAMASAQRVEELMSEAISAFRTYAGQDPSDSYDD